MIKYDPKVWFKLIFHSYTGYVVKALLPSLIFMGVYTSAICVAALKFNLFRTENETSIHSLVGIVLGLFLVFRTNTAYDRWWEGRKVWGMLVNNTRNFALRLNAFLDKDDKQNRSFVADRIPNYVDGLKVLLRAGVKGGVLDIPEGEAEEYFNKYEHKPNSIAASMYRRLNNLYKNNIITGEQLFLLDKEIKSFTDFVGMCERIKNTPIPYAYSMFMKKFLFIYIITLPYGLIETLEYWTIPTVLVLFYIFISIELIAEEIEDPFGEDENDLPTDELSGKIKNNVREALL